MGHNSERIHVFIALSFITIIILSTENENKTQSLWTNNEYSNDLFVSARNEGTRGNGVWLKSFILLIFNDLHMKSVAVPDFVAM